MAVTGIIERTVNIDGGVKHEDLRRLFAEADALAHTFKFNVVSDGTPQSLTGHTVVGYFMANGETIVISGSVSGNVATLVLPAACYAHVGGFQLIVRLVSGSTKTSIFWGSGYITNSTTETVIDPGSVVPDLDDVLAMIDEVDAATAAATAAADDANAAASKSIRYDTAQSLTTAQQAQAKSNIGLDVDNALQKLLPDNIPDTTQTYTFSGGSVSQVTHSRSGAVIRTDAFAYGATTITEVRTLNTGESLTIVTNLTTLETSVTYAAA